MKRYGEIYTLTQEDIDVIATYMDDDIREEMHGNIDYFTPEDFLKEYVKRDQDFETLLRNEFDIEL